MSESQHSKILKVLRDHPRGVPNHKFTDMRILKYSSRIAELRHDGHNIYCERVKRDGRATGTFLYFLNEEKEQKPRHFWQRNGK